MHSVMECLFFLYIYPSLPTSFPLCVAAMLPEDLHFHLASFDVLAVVPDLLIVLAEEDRFLKIKNSFIVIPPQLFRKRIPAIHP